MRFLHPFVCAPLLIGLLLCQEIKTATAEEEEAINYGVDISYPMHHGSISTNYPWLLHNTNPQIPTPDRYKDMPLQPLGDKVTQYNHFMDGCVKRYEKQNRGQRCWDNERDRIAMNLRQPQSMRNYTEFGFTKIRAPDHVFSLIKDFWEKNKDKPRPERWPSGNIYTNHWEQSSEMVSVEDISMDGGGFALKQLIWNAARDTMQEWTGQQVAECSLYGIRVYKEGSILAPHVDRLPLVSSAIINVDQDVDEPWPLEVIGHDGQAHNVTMLPGDLVLYESHSVIHGRPFPLKGRFMANVFVHFEPVGPLGGQVEADGGLPPYLIPGSPEAPNWHRSNPQGHRLMGKAGSFETGSTEAHQHAFGGEVDKLEAALDRNADLVNVRDKNGWTPLHEAIRSGKVETVRLLLDRGSDVNARVGQDGRGGSALFLAHAIEGNNREELIDLLKQRDGRLFVPDEL